MDERPLIELKGIVIAAAWGPNGEVSAVEIAAYDEQRYRIADSPIGRQLMKFEKKTVVIRGKIAIEHKQPIIYVDTFRHDDIEPTPAKLNG